LIDEFLLIFPQERPLGGGGSGRTVGSVIDGINVFAIASSEVIKRTVPCFGRWWKAGIISIFMKTGKRIKKLAK